LSKTAKYRITLKDQNGHEITQTIWLTSEQFDELDKALRILNNILGLKCDILYNDWIWII